MYRQSLREGLTQLSELPQKIRNYFTPEAAEALRKAIEEIKGNELFAVGQLDENDLIASVSIVARGSRSAVPAVERAVSYGEVVIHNHPSGDLTPSDADLRVASRLGNQGVGFLIVNNAVDDLYAVVEVIQVRARRLDGEKAFVRELLGPSGPIAENLPTYEHREEQLQMADDVVEAVFGKKYAILEAGTGTGKSLAYLVPCIVWARRANKKVVISTNTINLQEQLAYKDVPFLAAHLGIDFKAVLMKGRGNYVCIRKVRNLRSGSDSYLDENERAQLMTIVEAVEQRDIGSRSELPLQISGELWEMVCCEQDTCLRSRCPYIDSCYYFAMRRQAVQSDIIIANHHLLLADLSVRESLEADIDMAVLPRYDCVVFDEAHHLGDIVHQYLGDSVSTTQIERTLRRLWRRPASNSSGADSGTLVRLVQVLSLADQISQLSRSRAISVINLSLFATIARAVDLVNSLRGQLANLFAGMPEDEISSSIRLTHQVISDPLFEGVRVECERLASVLTEIVQQLKEVLTYTVPYEEELDRVEPGLCREVRALSDRCSSCATVLQSVMEPPQESSVHWIERTGAANRTNYSFHASPVELGSAFVDGVLGRLSAAVFTSATLTVQGSFDYFKRSLGLDVLPAGKVIERSIPSPFDFARQVLLCIASDTPPPDSPEFYDLLPGMLCKIISASSGRAFVLFTSYSVMRRAAEECRDYLTEQGYRLLVQGEAGRHHLINAFRDGTPSVLFGTDSFWEGVDVKGPSLSSVIIVKLPFRVPTEPLHQARLETIQARGGDPFTELSLPEAVIKFRQGFGRLIRSREDTGGVTVLDSRLVKRRYGRVFLESIPQCTRLVGSIDEIASGLRRWLTGVRT